ncbi:MULTISPECIES: hypothetical protein [Shewanella]|uniref:Uncharacterized protein n=1 Tax=Shewanella japonica TaxID=93973 RepID=A0ABM6JH36_9GAMM|nr:MULTISPECIES: hypothetical protein [Shewanella]ARD21527.1 hypothetical protein SJ2017_1200 [Shewanella japonica]KPZ71045.1 hypothetical protein AN944_01786 [Shewanella sp. P1-14-1]
MTDNKNNPQQETELNTDNRTSDQLSEVTDSAPAPQEQDKPLFPKRLIALMCVYVITSVSGLMAQQGVLLCILTLMMVLGVAGRQKAALYMLRAYAILQLALYSALPAIMYDPDNIVAGPTTVDFGFMQMVLSDWVIFTVLIVLALIQVWISFDKAVLKWFKPRMNFNIIS